MLKLQNKKFRVALHILYFIFSICYILAGQLDIDWLRHFKILPLGVIILLIVGQGKKIQQGELINGNEKEKQNINRKNSNNLLKIVSAIIAGAIGDIALQYWGHQSMFIIGAGFFLIGHVLYNIAIFDLWQQKSQLILFTKKLLIIISATFFLSVSLINLSTTISQKMIDEQYLILLVMPIYLILLSFNCINSFLLMISTPSHNKKSLSLSIDKYHFLLFFGTVMFLISDNVLGRAIFGDFRILGSKKINSLVIMGTYYLGQYFIGINIRKIYREEYLKIKNKKYKNNEQNRETIQSLITQQQKM